MTLQAVSLSRPRRLPLLGAAALLALLGACDREVILQGERLDPRAVISPDANVEGEATPTTAALSLPAVQGNADWTHRAGSPAHVSGNQALAGGTSRIWSAAIGEPIGLRHRITADPIVAGGLVFTLDSRARVTATTTGGATVWSTDVTPPMERDDSVSGGGLAFDGGRIFVTTEHGQLVALDPRSGGVLWRQRFDAPVSGAPTVSGGRVYVTARDATGWAVDAADGKLLWNVQGTRDIAGWMGVSAPAVAGDLVVFPFASGQLLGADAGSGQLRWSANVAGSRPGRAIAVIRDMTGDPVITGDRVIAGTSSGTIAAFDRATGVQLWRSRDGAMNPPLVVGNSIFAVSDEGSLIRLDAANGAKVWEVALPQFTETRPRRQDRVVAHYGPVLAGSRLYVASSDGLLRVFDPGSGGLIGQGDIPGGAGTAPVVAGQTLYVTGRDGQLHAFR
ncbi:PQQ-binding-like beta-propeller repeat protein [Paracoccus sp. S-4012]|uniref:outer membrane protein assembly factor BamB family protein n=1 Tax=Paracoccus sp. S-4012 TaxID=2665648 RepID=UPI0012B07462|nr:PQQ-binding-like beta-propeller repeat protein [Paracoccus sp. S-4012]MRX51238.1 PQQ-binding-like beta-propeller repeat protein [Paracoccus sp. S-4012]